MTSLASSGLGTAPATVNAPVSIVHADARVALAGLETDSVDAVVTDPPYECV